MVDELIGGCPFDGCGLPYWLEGDQLMRSSDVTGFAVVAFYRCDAGHRWQQALGPGVPQDGEEEL